MKTFVIVNPASANGRTGKNWPALRESLESVIGSFSFQFTELMKPASAIATTALQGGFERVISIGGDGTFSETVNGYFKDNKPVNPEAILAFITQGTGGDFQETLGSGKSFPDALSAISLNRVKRVDVGKITSKDNSNEEISRYFINIASFGMGGKIADRMNNSVFLKKLGGKTAFYLITLYTLVFYKNAPVSLGFNNKVIEAKIRNVAVANARFHGGGMMMAPDALTDDGLLDIVVFDNMSFLEMLFLSKKIYTGGHIGHPKVRTFRAGSIKVDSDIPIRIEVDGEVFGVLPADFEILPKALKLQF